MTISETHAATTGITSTEWSLITDTAAPQTATNDACVQVFLDLSALATGDKYRFRIKEKVRSTGTQRVVAQHVFANTQTRPVWASPTLILLHGWDVTMQKLAGVDRAIDFSVRELSQSSPSVNPTITDFTPISGDAGDTITITGTNFNGASQVLIGTTPASLTIVNNTTIITTVPSGMVPGDYFIHVLTPSFDAVSSTTFHVATFSGAVTLTSDYLVSAGQIAEWDPFVTTTVSVDNKNFIVGDGDGAGFVGTIRMRPNSPAIQHKLRFININEAGFVGGGLVPLSTDPGLWVMHEGKIDMVGHERRTWTRATAGLTAGQTSFTIPAGHNWQIGDTLVFVPTAPNTSTQYDERTINNVVGNTITISSGLTFAHPSVTLPNAQVMLPEILNTTSNVMIEGQDATHRAHWFNHAHNTAADHTIKNVAVKFMGPRKNGLRVLGRWPIHFHHAADHLDGLVIENCVVRDSGSFAFVAHASEGITFSKCVGHNNQESQFWWDHDIPDDISQRIKYLDCVASKTLTGDAGEGSSQGRLSAFYLDRNGLGHEASRCIAVGTASIGASGRSSGFFWPETDTSVGSDQTQGFWIFDDCISHNNAAWGILTWENTGGNVHPNWNNTITYHNAGSGCNMGAYGFDVTLQNWISFKDGWGTFLPYSLRGNAMRVTYNNPILDGGGEPTYGVHQHEAISALPNITRFIDPVIKGFTSTALLWDTGVQPVDPRNASLDFVRPRIGDTGRDMEATDITFVSGRQGDRVRVQRQNNLSAWQFLMNTNTSFVITEIAPFA